MNTMKQTATEHKDDVREIPSAMQALGSAINAVLERFEVLSVRLGPLLREDGPMLNRDAGEKECNNGQGAELTRQLDAYSCRLVQLVGDQEQLLNRLAI